VGNHLTVHYPGVCCANWINLLSVGFEPQPDGSQDRPRSRREFRDPREEIPFGNFGWSYVCSCLHYQRPRAKGTLQTRPASGTHSTQHAPTQGSERSPKPSERAATFFDRSNSWGWLQNSNGNRHSHTPFKILKTFELGSPSSFAIARPVSPCALILITSSPDGPTLALSPSLRRSPH
jgi:hypothetical protein